MGEPGGLPSLGLHRAGHDWSDLAAAVGHTKEFLERGLSDKLLRKCARVIYGRF